MSFCLRAFIVPSHSPTLPRSLARHDGAVHPHRNAHNLCVCLNLATIEFGLLGLLQTIVELSIGGVIVDAQVFNIEQLLCIAL